MICYNCNSQLPDNSQFCNYCGASFYNAPQSPQGYVQPQPQQSFNYYPQPSTQYATKKSSKGIILGICVAILYIAVIVLVVLNINNRYEDKKVDMISDLSDIEESIEASTHEYNGTYVFDRCEMYGMSYTAAEMEEMSGESFDMKLIINGNLCTLDAESMGYDKASCKIEIKNDVVTLIDGREELVGTYDKNEKSITLNSAGVDMVFVKK